MIRSITFLIISLSSLILPSCSLKHKWHTKEKESLKQRKQEHITHMLTSNQILFDTTFTHTQLSHVNYQLWSLHGNVHLNPNGSLQTDHATIQSWQTTWADQQSSSSKTTYQNKKVEQESLTNETTRRNKQSIEKKKWKVATNWWWVMLMVIFVAIWRVLRKS